MNIRGKKVALYCFVGYMMRRKYGENVTVFKKYLKTACLLSRGSFRNL
jgi:hypothetical protein